jgi:hypothetical protein
VILTTAGLIVAKYRINRITREQASAPAALDVVAPAKFEWEVAP